MTIIAQIDAALAALGDCGYPATLAREMIRAEAGNDPTAIVRRGGQRFWEVGLAQATVDDAGAGDASRYNADPRTVVGGVWILRARAAADAAFLGADVYRVAPELGDPATVAALGAYSVGRRGLRAYLRTLPDACGWDRVAACAPAIGVQSAAKVRMRLARVLKRATAHPGGWSAPLPPRPPTVPRYPRAAVLTWCRAARPVEE